MKKPVTILVLLSFSTLFYFNSCNKDDDCNCDEHLVAECEEIAGKTNIRIQNNSTYDFCNLVLSPYGTAKNYGLLKSGEISCYRAFDLAYSYAYIQCYINEIEFVLLPIDYVGATPLGAGNFTYVLGDVDFESRFFTIDAVKD